MQEINLDKRDKYLANYFHLLRFAPAQYDYRWFCRYIVREKWWDSFVLYNLEKHNNSTVETSEVVKWFMDPDEMVNAVYTFLVLTEPEAEEKEPEKPKIIYGKAPTECPVDPVARARCPECAER